MATLERIWNHMRMNRKGELHLVLQAKGEGHSLHPLHRMQAQAVPCPLPQALLWQPRILLTVLRALPWQS